MKVKLFAPVTLLLLCAGLASSATAQCTPSSADPEFLHYLEGSPERSILFGNNEGQKPLRLVGTLMSDKCQTIENALVEVWGATPEGCYSGEIDCNNRGDEYFLRGSVRTDELGRFEFTTLYPGKHVVGDKLRPAHLNLRVTAGTFELNTQLYFEGDELIASDSSASHPLAADRVRTVYEEGAERAVILTLTMNTTASVYNKLSENIGVYPAIFSDRLTLHGEAASSNVTATLLDLHGRSILRSEHAVTGQNIFDRDELLALSPGVYCLLLERKGERHLVKLLKQ